ncbi:MAG: translation initiation factor IF-2 associated domain-containing protein, partial [Methylomicrobium sp.]|nr:translation initiation factor IF-2 associated domain-containing protein [Methylomicrobium sp.]
MSDKTVRQLAEVVGIPLERLLEQLKEAGLSVHAPDDVISEDEKVKLLAHLRKRHGKSTGETDAAPKRVTLKRRTVSELKQSNAPGSSAKTISIEVRKKKTYVKRTEVAAESDEPKESEEIKKTAEQIQAEPTPVS